MLTLCIRYKSICTNPPNRRGAGLSRTGAAAETSSAISFPLNSRAPATSPTHRSKDRSFLPRVPEYGTPRQGSAFWRSRKSMVNAMSMGLIVPQGNHNVQNALHCLVTPIHSLLAQQD
jgi:hypothetical protein